MSKPVILQFNSSWCTVEMGCSNDEMLRHLLQLHIAAEEAIV